jgi:hypothetical protein
MAQASELPWTYGHPYDDPLISFPLLGETINPAPTPANATSLPEGFSRATSIALLIPTFPDDPKARFLGEIASTTSETDVPPPRPRPTSPVSPTRSRNASSSNSTTSSSRSPANSSPSHSPVKKRRRVDEGAHVHPLTDDASIDLAEKPEGTSSKTEVASDTVSALPESSTVLHPESDPIQEKPSTPPPNTSVTAKGTTHSETELVRRGRQALAAVSAQEFWERMGFRQECALGAVTAFFVAVFEHHDTPPKSSDTKLLKECIPLPTHTRIMQSLMNHAFSTPEKAIRSTLMLESSIRTLCDGTSSASEGQAGDTTQEASSFYHTHIHKTINVNNPPLVPRESAPVQAQPVNVLQVKRKVRR